jgi:hypothetical protein
MNDHDLSKQWRESKPIGKDKAVKIRNLSAKIHQAQQALAMADGFLELQGNPVDRGLRVFIRQAFKGFTP